MNKMRIFGKKNRKNSNKDKVIDSSATSSKTQSENVAILKGSDEEATKDGKTAETVTQPAQSIEVDLINKKLPKELLIRVFSYLDPVTLCRCAQVSKVSPHLI